MYQKHILDKLRHADQLRYSELQPEGVESSHFKYHLDQLVKDGVVERRDRGIYALSDKGKAAVDRLSEGRINPELTPKVITYTLLKDSENYYLYRKDKEPYRGLLTMIAGKMHLDESATDAVVREVHEKIDHVITNPELRLMANIRVHSGDQLITHVLAYVFVADFAGDSMKLEKVPITEIASYSDTTPDLLPMIAYINMNSTFGHLELNL